MARRRGRSVGFLERVVVTPRAWHTPENTERRVELGRFSPYSKLIPSRRLGLSRFPRFVSKGWQNDACGHSSTFTSDRYRRRVRLSRLSPSAGQAGPGRAGPGRAGPRRAVTVGRPSFGTRPAARLRRTRPGRASACDRRRASERDQASAHLTGPGFGTPLPQLIPRRRVGFSRFPRFVQLSPC